MGLGFLFFPLTYLFWVTLVFEVPTVQYVSLFLSPIFYLIAGWMILTGVGLWEMHRWIWWVLLVSCILLTYENADVLMRLSQSQHKGFAFLFSTLALTFMFLRINRELRVPYFLPSIRWWEADARGKFQSAALVRSADDDSVEIRPGRLLDLSPIGCFVQTPHRFKHDENVVIEFKEFDLEVALPGAVVWRAESAVTHPSGIGVRFERLSREQRKQVRLILLRKRRLQRLALRAKKT